MDTREEEFVSEGASGPGARGEEEEQAAEGASGQGAPGEED